MDEAQPFKHYYGVELAQRLAADIQPAYPAFPAEQFITDVATGVEPLELKARVALISERLQAYLPADYLEALVILRATLGPEIVGEAGMFNEGYYVMPIAQFVESYGLEHFEVSMEMLYEITKRFSSEFAIRPYIERYPEETLTRLHAWTQDPNQHVRRLVSEGTRTRLPWASRLTEFVANPAPVLALLEKLKDDPSAYVRKSVANNLNDISKDHRDLVLETLTRWKVDASDHRRWVIRHALRTLVKQGDTQALGLLDYAAPEISIQRLELAPATIQLGDTFTLTLELHSTATESQNLIIDYLVHFVRARETTIPKVFKLTTTTLAPGGRVTLEKRHTLKPVTVRRYYTGEHRVEVQINGQIVGSTHFLLSVE